MSFYLISTPVPDSVDGDSENHCRPWKVAVNRVSEHVHRIVVWNSASGIRGTYIRNRGQIHGFQVVVPANIIES